MSVAVIIVAVAVLCFATIFWVKRTKNNRQLEGHSISAEELHSSISSGSKVLVFDVRQPLDILAYPELIPGAQRVPPEEVLQKPSIIPRDQDVVVYCTCPAEKTSRAVLRRALAVGLTRVKFLRGGLAGWKGMGFPVEPFSGTLAFSPAITVPRAR